MAQLLKLNSGGAFAKSPIIYEVTAQSLTGDITFHLVKMKVTATISNEPTATDYEMEQNSDSGEVHSFNISSALSALIDNYEFTAVPPAEYPYIQFHISVWDEYMKDGQLFNNVGIINDNGGCALFGAFSDYERYTSGLTRTITNMSSKPTSTPEILEAGETFIKPKTLAGATLLNITAGPQSVQYPITIDTNNPEGMRVIDGVNVYVRNPSIDRYQFRFINRFGVMESIAVNSLVSIQTAITSTKSTLAQLNVFNDVARGMIRKSNDIEEWKLSSGPVDKNWQQWFIHEFMMSSWVWIYYRDTWVRCHVKPGENVSGYNGYDGNPLTADFSIELDITGY